MKRYENIRCVLNRMVFGAALLAAASGIPACDNDDAFSEESLATETGPDVEQQVLRFVYYNTLEGMKLDRENNFDNFVAWVQKQDPDLLALGECNNFTQESLLELAKRYGHTSAVICKETGYPVALTSKYPIELRNRMLDDAPLWHGAIHTVVKGINVVVLHLYPFGDNHTPEIPVGNEYRNAEVNYILDNTIRKYPAEPAWIMCGDFNSDSPLDEEAVGNRYFTTHEIVLESGYYDVLRERHSQFYRSVPTVYGGWPEGTARRIDFIYASQSIVRDLVESKILYDDFTDTHSDHYPVLMEFRHYADND